MRFPHCGGHFNPCWLIELHSVEYMQLLLSMKGICELRVTNCELRVTSCEWHFCKLENYESCKFVHIFLTLGIDLNSLPLSK